MKKIFDWGVWLRWGLPICVGVFLWATQVQATLDKANAAPTKEDLQREIAQASVQFRNELQIMKEDLREIKTDLKWLVKEKK